MASLFELQIQEPKPWCNIRCQNLQVDGIASGLSSMVVRTLTPTQVNDLFANPLELIAAPGQNKLIFVSSVNTIYKYSTAPFIDSVDVTLKYHGGDTAFLKTSNQLGVLNEDDSLSSFTKQNSYTLSSDINKGVQLTTSAQLTGGGASTLTLLVTYYVVDFS